MYFVVNLGLKSIRGIVYTKSGDEVFSYSKEVHTSLLGDRVEQQVSEWNNHLLEILQELKKNPHIISRIKYITSTTSSSCIFGIDNKQNPLTPVLMVSDKRSNKEVKYLKDHSVYQKIQSENVICETSTMIPKVLWYKNNDLSTFTKIKKWLGANEYLNYYFSGHIVSDPLNAAKAFYSDGSYMTDVLQSIGLDSNILPRVVPIGTKYSVKKSILSEYGFNDHVEYIITTYDAICAVIGSDSGQKGNACDVSGTVTSVRLMTDKGGSGENGKLISNRIDLINKYVVGSSNNLGGGIVEWYKQAFFPGKGSEVYSELITGAGSVPAGSGGLLFLPYLLGERSPFNQPDSTGSFFGITRTTNVNHFTRAVFESTAFVTRNLMQLIVDEGYQIDSISTSGGLARLDIINQIKADVCNKPIHVVENFESTALGALILMSLANKLYKHIFEAQREIVKVRKIIHPSSQNVKVYEKYFQLHNQLNRRLKSFYSEHKVIANGDIMKLSSTLRNL